jgi:hypothetical protein
LTIENGLDLDTTNAAGIVNQGTLTVTNAVFSGNVGGNYTCGAIYNQGTMTVNDSTFTANGGRKTDLCNYSGGNATITNSTFSANSGYNAGVSNEASTMAISGSTFTGNVVSNGPGAVESGVYGGGGTLTVTDSVFSGNSGEEGGAIQIDGGSGTITNSTFTNNTGGAHAGAIDIADHSADCGACAGTATVGISGSTFSGNHSNGNDGGAILNGNAGGSGTVTVSNSTFTGNSAGYGDSGGAIANVGGTVTVTNSTLSGNTAGTGGQGDNIYNTDTLNLGTTIVANPAAVGNCALGTYTDLGYNLDDDGTCGFSGTGDLSATSAGLDPGGLADNGGPTQTIALESGSAAIRAVTNATLCPATDQRGFPRNVPCDIGAYDTDTIVAPCSPGTTGCSAMVKAPSQTVVVSGTKAASSSASITLVVAPAVLSCQNFSYLAPVATLTDSGLKTGTDVVVTDTVKGLPSKKGVVICYQSVGDSAQTPTFLAKCHGSRFVGACSKSLTEMDGNVVAKLELPVGDPRFHIGAETPAVTSISPTTAAPGKKLSIKGLNLSEVTGVAIGGVPARIIKTAPTKVTVTVPAGAKSGTIRVTSLAGSSTSVAQLTVTGPRSAVHASKHKGDKHRSR